MRQVRILAATVVAAAIVALAGGLPASRAWRAESASGEGPWRRVAPGLEIGRFPLEAGAGAQEAARQDEPGAPPEIVVVRVDPRRWDLKLLAASSEPDRTPRSVRQWCRDRGLVAAVNAGMYQADHLTHAGYLRLGDHVNNPTPNRYTSAAAFRPRREGLPPFRIYDLEERELQALARDYEHVVQNLRLVRRPRENRWMTRGEPWSEVALGEDGQGRALLIFNRVPVPVRDLNEALLALPLDLVSAQHLEGGSQAQLFLEHAGARLDLAGRQEGEGADDRRLWRRPVPNVIGIAPRPGGGPAGG